MALELIESDFHAGGTETYLYNFKSDLVKYLA